MTDLTPELLRLVAGVAADYCPTLEPLFVVKVVRAEFSDPSHRTVEEIEESVRRMLDLALGDPPEEFPNLDVGATVRTQNASTWAG